MLDLLGDAKKTERIRQLNDAFRTTFAGGMVVMSASVAELPDMVKAAALETVAEFNAFDGTNNPHEEHDFGAFELCNRLFFWKLDYYNADMTGGSEDPSDSEQTTRVLTLMLSGDY